MPLDCTLILTIPLTSRQVTHSLCLNVHGLAVVYCAEPVVPGHLIDPVQLTVLVSRSSQLL